MNNTNFITGSHISQVFLLLSHPPLQLSHSPFHVNKVSHKHSLSVHKGAYPIRAMGHFFCFLLLLEKFSAFLSHAVYLTSQLLSEQTFLYSHTQYYNTVLVQLLSPIQYIIYIQRRHWAKIQLLEHGVYRSVSAAWVPPVASGCCWSPIFGGYFIIFGHTDMLCILGLPYWHWTANVTFHLGS